MGYDIFAYGNHHKQVGYLYPVASTFSAMAEQGYDWFSLIGASDMDGGCSGTGRTKKIKAKNLNRALEAMKTRRPMETVEMESFMGHLTRFMESSMCWCRENHRGSILMGFY